MTEAERSLHPLFCRRHYCRIAKLIEGLAIARDDPEFIADQFCEMFAADNPRFDPRRFLAACGPRG